MVVLVVIEFRVASPRSGHAARRDISAILDEAEEFIFVHCLTKFSQYVIVYVSSVAAGFEKGSSVSEPSGAVFSRKQVGADGQKNCERVTIWIHFRLIRQPIKNAEGNP
jgi:hypothetical protein